MPDWHWIEWLAPVHDQRMPNARHIRFASLLASCFTLAACASAHRTAPPTGEPPEDDGGSTPVVDVDAGEPAESDGGEVIVPLSSPLEACLDSGGHLVIADTVDNNDTTDHGAIAAFAASATGTLAAAGTDGTIKFWTLDGGLVGTVNNAELLYGPELPGVEAADMQFMDDERVVAGDVQGIVSAWGADGFMQILGGVDPGIGIVAVALDGARTRLAHADVRSGGSLTVRALDGSSVVGPIETSMLSVHDLVFLPSGELLVAGADASGVGVVELRDAADPARVIAPYRSAASAAFAEVAASADGRRIAAAGGAEVALFDAALGAPRAALVAAHGARTVAVTPGGRFVLTGGTDGTLRALAGDDGHEVTSIAIADPIAVRIDARGEARVRGVRRRRAHPRDRLRALRARAPRAQRTSSTPHARACASSATSRARSSRSRSGSRQRRSTRSAPSATRASIRATSLPSWRMGQT